MHEKRVFVSFKANGELIITTSWSIRMMSTSALNHHRWIGLDIGGANIKTAHEDGHCPDGSL